MKVDQVADEAGQPMQFTIQQDSFESVLIASLNRPVPAGGQFAYSVDLTFTNLVQRGIADGEYVLQTHDHPDDECTTHSVDSYRLPAGAVVLAKRPENLKQLVSGGRTELQIERTILPGHVRDFSLRYRLPGGTQ